MKLAPIVLAAYGSLGSSGNSGSTSATQAVYDHLERVVSDQLTNHPLFWVGTSDRVRALARSQGRECFPEPSVVLEQLARQGIERAVVQSLHVLPAAGYVRLRHLCLRADLVTAVGAPLLYGPADFQAVADCLAPLIEARPGQAILLVGHGTYHPAWTAFPALELYLRRRFGQRVFVGVVEKFPGGTEEMVTRIAAGEYQRVCLVPLLLSAGMHFNRDLVGAEATSWLSRLHRAGLDVELIEEGLGLLPGIAEIFCEHIRTALKELEPEK
ncbi:MAG: sirohydrochlorin cobaltochelatase [Desulfobulbaceae bacterium]|uniref:Sirohydrochlorin cobaltochelatase n=1 Tax=Candidatus Desulfatifera sulfidica TaxID=2841691 RepID=A0A8J6N9J4_9BACT|nr:sirohydrochlorin cobaltochelatase [Candidatus Desulfatifera sulfidica]